ncbi:MAG: hypothetical protein Q9219_007545 [cf. Caloplaca sp. 3 TL-2023]
MTTQYDHIGTLFDQMRTLTPARLAHDNVRAALAPYVNGAKTLDLACGTGHYSRLLLDWGAASVLGVDISNTMVAAAKQQQQQYTQAPKNDGRKNSNNANFLVADCAIPTTYDGAPFDVVLGCWLLNYAPSKKEMIEMYHTIALNLKPGGRFISVTPHPSDTPKALIQKAQEVRPIRYEGIEVSVKREVEDGVETHLKAVMAGGNVEFDAFHLKKSVYEEAAREGGLGGSLEWREVVISEEEMRKDEEWKTYLTVPHFAVLVIEK